MRLINYDSIPAVRRSDLWEIRKSPAHYRYAVTHPKPPTTALVFGTAAHKYVLEKEDFWNQYSLAPEVDRRTKAGKKTWQEHLHRMAELGTDGISVTDYTIIQEMADAVWGHPTAAKLLTGEHEIPIEWTDPETGEQCKCRPDCISDEYIVDYKTTTSCAPGHFERSCRLYGYKLQAAMYTEGVFQNRLEQKKFAFIAQEKEPPYAVRVYFCDPGFVDEGMDLYRKYINLYHKCKTSGEWPGYEDGELIGDE